MKSWINKLSTSRYLRTAIVATAIVGASKPNHLLACYGDFGSTLAQGTGGGGGGWDSGPGSPTITVPDPNTNATTCGGVSGDAGVNPFTVGDGNVSRRVADLRIYGGSRNRLNWIRYNNTRPRRSDGDIFGRAGNWRHSWQFTLVEIPSLTNAAQAGSLNLIYPSGFRREFDPLPGGGWAVEAPYREKVAVTAAGYNITTSDGCLLQFVREPRAAGGSRLEMQQLPDSFGLNTALTYDSAGYLQRVTDPTNRFLQLSYRDIPFVQWDRSRIKTLTGQAGWQEVDMPAALSGRVVQAIRLRLADGSLCGVAEIRVFAPASATPLSGTVTGSNSTAAAAFDGDTTSAFVATPGVINWCQLNFANSLATPIAKIMVLAEAGANLNGAAVETLVSSPASDHVLAAVQGSDGRTVNYTYDSTIGGVPALVGTQYNDGTAAAYTYTAEFVGTRPLLETANDPRFLGIAKQIKYAYRLDRYATAGMIAQEINPATGNAYASLQLDPNDPLKRTVEYSDLRQEYYEMSPLGEGRLASETDSLGRTTQFSYDAAGRTATKTDHAGRVTTYSYNSDNQVVASQQGTQNPVRFERDTAGRLTKITDPYRRTTSYTRDQNGRVLAAKYFDGSSQTFTYDSLGHVTSLTDRDGLNRQFCYDPTGLLQSATDAKGQVTNYLHNGLGGLAAVTDAIGRTKSYARNDMGQVTKITNEDGTTQSYGFDAYGHLISSTDIFGRVTTITPDAFGRMVRKVAPNGDVTTLDYAELPNSCGCATLSSQPTTVVSPDGQTTARLFDTEGRRLSITMASGSPASATTQFAYDDDNHVISTTDALGRTTKFSYDDEGHRVSSTDPSGRVTTFAYDVYGNVTSVSLPDGRKSSATYDSSSRMLSSTDLSGNTTTRTYDSVGNLASETNSQNAIFQFAYDGRRQTGITYPDNKQKTFTYDAVGRPTQVRNPDGLAESYTYDAGDRLTSKTDSLGRKTTYTRDVHGQIVSTTDVWGQVTNSSYNSDGTLNSVTLPNGKVTTRTYDGKGRLIGLIDNKGRSMAIAYDAAGNQATITDSSSGSKNLSYDARHRTTGVAFSDGTHQHWSYDAFGNVTSRTDRAGRVESTSYNSDVKPVRRSWSPAGSAPDISYTYDASGRVTGLDNGEVHLTYVYDAEGRVVSEVSDLSALVPGIASTTVQFGYASRANGPGKQVTYPDGTTFDYRYNSRGEILEVDGSANGLVAAFSYDSAGRRSSINRGNGVVTTFAYDAADRVQAIGHELGSKVISYTQLTLNGSGLITAKAREDGASEVYSYDDEGQVTGDSGTGDTPSLVTQTDQFQYDEEGNRQKHLRTSSSGAVATDYVANGLNQYTAIEGSPAATFVPTYDANGNLTAAPGATYQFNALNQLTSVIRGSQKTDLYYDPRGRCVYRADSRLNTQGTWVLAGSQSTLITYSGWEAILERDGNGASLGIYVPGSLPSELLQATVGGQTVYPLTDNNNSTVALTNGLGTVIGRYCYDVFGAPKALNANYTVNGADGGAYHHLFQGQEWMASAQVYDFRNRAYLPALGRFAQLDPLGAAGGDTNWYNFEHNSPTNQSDPLGLCCENEAQAVNQAQVSVQIASDALNRDQGTLNNDQALLTAATYVAGVAIGSAAYDSWVVYVSCFASGIQLGVDPATDAACAAATTAWIKDSAAGASAQTAVVLAQSAVAADQTQVSSDQQTFSSAQSSLQDASLAYSLCEIINVANTADPNCPCQ